MILVSTCIALVIFLSACGSDIPAIEPAPTVLPTLTPEPLVPTRTPISNAEATSTADETAVPTAVSTETRTPAATSDHNDAAQSEPPEQMIPKNRTLERFGVTGDVNDAQTAFEIGLPFGVMLNWNVGLDLPDTEFEFWQMVRTEEAGIRRTTWDEIALAITKYPGSYWMVGNEPDVRWQDNVTPQRYAEIYHDVYTFIKERDPEAKLIIGGVTQPTPLRRAYLDIVLDTYEEKYGEQMPIDVWNVHAFTLREERDSWGVDIPPGMEDDLAIQYEIDDHDDLDILRQNLIEFRSWMAERGYGDKPLIISEYGILMPEDYGFPPSRVADFLTDSFHLFQTLTGDTGYSLDEDRLVQRWFWYSVYDPSVYPTGNLLDQPNGELTALGETWAEYIVGLDANAGLQP